MMCLNPCVFERLRREVLETFNPTEMPTFDGVKKMKYLRAVLNGKHAMGPHRAAPVLTPHTETLRLYPIVYVTTTIQEAV